MRSAITVPQAEFPLENVSPSWKNKFRVLIRNVRSGTYYRNLTANVIVIYF